MTLDLRSRICPSFSRVARPLTVSSGIWHQIERVRIRILSAMSCDPSSGGKNGAQVLEFGRYLVGPGLFFSLCFILLVLRIMYECKVKYTYNEDLLSYRCRKLKNVVLHHKINSVHSECQPEKNPCWMPSILCKWGKIINCLIENSLLIGTKPEKLRKWFTREVMNEQFVRREPLLCCRPSLQDWAGEGYFAIMSEIELAS